MTFGFSAAQAVLREIKTTEAGSLSLRASKDDSDLLNLLIDSERLKVEEIDRALEDSVILEAKRAVKILKKTNKFFRNYTDHASTDPSYISYAIQKGYLNGRELKILEKNLDHEKDLDEFCEHYTSNNLIPKIRNKLLGY